jgi:hypothetical protein
MKEVAMSGTYNGPPKYLKQRSMPMEIPMECVRRLTEAVDLDYDDRCSLDELRTYIGLKELPIEDSVICEMFEEAISGRGFITEKQRTSPLSNEEIAACVRGRHRWNTKTLEWEVAYRKFRNYWIVLLLTQNQRIFALPMPKIVPSKIKAQYELEDDYRKTLTQTTVN